MRDLIPATPAASVRDLRQRAAEFERLAQQTRDPLLLHQFQALSERFGRAAGDGPAGEAA
jgi:hypothetical protein